jgi:AraC family transcriptional regulator
MNYRIVEKESFKLIGFKKRVPIIFNGVNPEIVKMYESLTHEIIMELKSMSDIEPKGFISASTNFSEGKWKRRGSSITILVLPHRIKIKPHTMN